MQYTLNMAVLICILELQTQFSFHLVKRNKSKNRYIYLFKLINVDQNQAISKSPIAKIMKLRILWKIWVGCQIWTESQSVIIIFAKWVMFVFCLFSALESIFLSTQVAGWLSPRTFHLFYEPWLNRFYTNICNQFFLSL